TPPREQVKQAPPPARPATRRPDPPRHAPQPAQPAVPAKAPAQEGKAWIVIAIIAMITVPIYLTLQKKKTAPKSERRSKTHRVRTSKSRVPTWKERNRKKYADARNRIDQARKDLKASPAQTAQNEDFAAEKGCFVQNKAASCEKWAINHEDKRYTDKSVFQRVLKARITACKKKYVNSCKALAEYVRTDVKSMTPEQKREYYGLACEFGSNIFSCDRLAFMEVFGVGGPEDHVAARRHITGVCSKHGFYCWDEGEVKEVAAWKALGKGRPKATPEQVWVGLIYIKHTNKSFTDDVAKLKQEAITKMEAAIPLGGYLPVASMLNKSLYPKKPKSKRYVQVKVRLVNDALVPARVELAMDFVFKKGIPLARAKRTHTSCYPIDKRKKQCTTLAMIKEQPALATQIVELAPQSTRVALLEFDTSVMYKDFPVFDSFTLKKATVSWPRGPVGPRPDKKQLMTLSGPYAEILDVYKKSCERNKKTRPNDLMCRYIKNLGKHRKEDLFALCNERKKGEAFVDGACFRLKDRFGVDVFKTATK
ncbi:hypothetical protein KJ865_17100, partial [Myxococcota bacterium]|nr:hypothetical protein [Myxococcota bacterium]